MAEIRGRARLLGGCRGRRLGCGGGGAAAPARIARGGAPLGLPRAVLADEDILVPSGLRDGRTALARLYERPPRPRRGGVTIDGDHEVRQQVVVAGLVGARAQVLL